MVPEYAVALLEPVGPWLGCWDTYGFVGAQEVCGRQTNSHPGSMDIQETKKQSGMRFRQVQSLKNDPCVQYISTSYVCHVLAAEIYCS